LKRHNRIKGRGKTTRHGQAERLLGTVVFERRWGVAESTHTGSARLGQAQPPRTPNQEARAQREREGDAHRVMAATKVGRTCPHSRRCHAPTHALTHTHMNTFIPSQAGTQDPLHQHNTDRSIDIHPPLIGECDTRASLPLLSPLALSRCLSVTDKRTLDDRQCRTQADRQTGTKRVHVMKHHDQSIRPTFHTGRSSNQPHAHSVRLAVSLSVCLSVCLFVCSSVCLSWHHRAKDGRPKRERCTGREAGRQPPHSTTEMSHHTSHITPADATHKLERIGGRQAAHTH